MSHISKDEIKSLEEIDILKVAKFLGIEIKNKKSLCFLHDEKTPSLSFDSKRNRWRCFGCSKHGGVINLVMQYRGLTFHDACNWIQSVFRGGHTDSGIFAGNVSKKQSVSAHLINYGANPDINLYSEIIESLVLNSEDMEYLKRERALAESVICQNRVKSLDNLAEFYSRVEAKYGVVRLIDAGLLKVDENGEIKKSWWRPGILFPFYSYEGKIENIQMRPYSPFPPNVKYIFLSGIRTILYNEQTLRTCDIGDSLYICEGAIDTLSMLSKGLNAVGVPGVSNFQDDWIDLIGQFNVRILFDNDTAGIKNAGKLIEKLRKKNISASILSVSPFNDINEMLVSERGRNEQ